MEAFDHLGILEPYLVATVDYILPLCSILTMVALSNLPPT
jgi:hypothetical protein